MERPSNNANCSELSHQPSRTGLINPVGYSTNPAPLDRPVRIFAHGVFDLFHTGHVQFLETVKTSFPNTHVIVGVTTDLDTIRVKGLTVISASDRAKIVRGCKYVDEVIQNCEPVLTPEFMDEYRIDYFAHADTTEPDPYRFVKEQGRFLVIPRAEQLDSTTQIISRVIRNRDEYVLRQVKNGVVLADMKVSWLRFQWIKVRKRYF
ncbi:hypothetical protein GGR51DRAFT_430728 [Nemania sp. FL0031]|nr:hypothetical protein GGR51DRAFT_430728 [Nemania sp. FL0031]